MTNTKGKVAISLLGLPGSGKGTQADYLKNIYDGQIVSIGELVRREIDANHNLSSEIIEKYNKGVPQDDKFVKELVEKALKSSKNNFVVLDNYPFSKEQLDDYKKITQDHGYTKKIMLNIIISPATALDRISHRLICPKCKISLIDDRSSDHCPKCGHKLVERRDDKAEVVKKRIDEYLPRVEEITKLFDKIGQVVKVDGEKSPEEVKDEIISKVDKWIN